MFHSNDALYVIAFVLQSTTYWTTTIMTMMLLLLLAMVRAAVVVGLLNSTGTAPQLHMEQCQEKEKAVEKALPAKRKRGL